MRHRGLDGDDHVGLKRNVQHRSLNRFVRFSIACRSIIPRSSVRRLFADWRGDAGITLSRRFHREPSCGIKCRIRLPPELRLPEGRVCGVLGSRHRDIFRGFESGYGIDVRQIQGPKLWL
jgi:hypothetical protein